MKGKIAQVIIDGATATFDKKYSYKLPLGFDEKTVGCRALIPFGRANIKKQCLIVDVSEGETDNLKEIISVTDKTPVLNKEMIDMSEYLYEHTFCTRYDGVHAMLPTGINYKLTDYYSYNPQFSADAFLSEEEKRITEFIKAKGEISFDKLKKEFGEISDTMTSLSEKEAVLKNCTPIRNTGDATEKWIRPLKTLEEAEGIKLTARQKEVFSVLTDIGAVSLKELCYFTGVSVSVVNALIDKGLVTAYEKEVFRTPYRGVKPQLRSEIVLTDEQQKAYLGMKELIASGKGAVSLLYGVTGSGKTQVFLKLVDEVSDAGKGVIVMVPEIALTPQMINIFSSRYGDKIAVFHSAMSTGQRMDEWKRIKSGKALIAIGTRSAIFAPFENLGLIIIDEEQEHTYKSEKSPRFHARDLAKFRASYNNALLCLASATPSMESYTAAKSGRYSLFTLKNRYGNAVLPEVKTVDMRKEILSGNSSAISKVLYDSIEDTLKAKKQSIILLNRRGHNTYISCPDCGYVEACPNCSISLTYHSANKRLMCHYCGYSKSVDNKCPECSGENMKFMGLGTQKVAEELEMLFPEARILRLDADSTMTRDSYSTYLEAFSRGEYDIMLGTQMVAKGLDFPNVTLVGVLGAEKAMYSEDYRSFERTFSLLTQVVGRAGRGESAGKAVVQTVAPDSNIIELAARQDYESFYNEEISVRQLMTFPPYCDICTLVTQSTDKLCAEEAIKEIFDKIKENLSGDYKDVKIIILGPSAASIPKMNNKYRYRMIIKCKNNRRFREMLRNSISIKAKRDISVLVDINPETVI